MEPYRLRLREKERQLARVQREQERTVEEQHEQALKAAAQHGIPTELFPLEAPWSLFPWDEQLGPRADCEAHRLLYTPVPPPVTSAGTPYRPTASASSPRLQESLRLAIGLRDLERLGHYLTLGQERGLTKQNSHIFYAATELNELLVAEGAAQVHPPAGMEG